MARVDVYVTLKPTLLDAQGKVVHSALKNLGYTNIEGVRIGKYIQLSVNDNSENLTEEIEEACRKLLSNPVIEDYRYEIIKDEEKP
ncbi:MAG: phosphoribosylformylglycinamidine synthase subunit PurS [Armatimonadota bacterium]